MASWMPKQAAMTACHLGGCCSSSCQRELITAVQDCNHVAGSSCPVLSWPASSAHPFVFSFADSSVRECVWEADLLMSVPEDMALASLPVPTRNMAGLQSGLRMNRMVIAAMCLQQGPLPEICASVCASVRNILGQPFPAWVPWPAVAAAAGASSASMSASATLSASRVA